jgi:predicted SnoaL-like aldol condensation-catalyzing enzyme
MATEQERNRALVLQLYDEVWNKGNLGFVNSAVSPKFQDHPSQRFYQLPTNGREAITEAVKHFRSAMPDFHDQMIQIVSEGDRVYYLGRITGTQTAPFFQVPASGKKISVTGISGYRLESGMIVECWGVLDVMGLMTQLGMVPAAPSGH